MGYFNIYDTNTNYFIWLYKFRIKYQQLIFKTRKSCDDKVALVWPRSEATFCCADKVALVWPCPKAPFTLRGSFIPRTFYPFISPRGVHTEGIFYPFVSFDCVHIEVMFYPLVLCGRFAELVKLRILLTRNNSKVYVCFDLMGFKLKI